MMVNYCRDCRWQSYSYCEHPEIGFISAAPSRHGVTKGVCKSCEDIRKDGQRECAGFTPHQGFIDLAWRKITGTLLEVK